MKPDSKESLTDKDIEGIITALSDALDTPGAFAGLHDIVFDSADYPMATAENASLNWTCSVSHRIDREARAYAEKALEAAGVDYEGLPRGSRCRLTTLWFSWQKAEKPLARFITDLEGTPACSVDRARYILKEYEKCVRNGIWDFEALVPEDYEDDGERAWNHPSHGLLTCWLRLADALLFDRLNFDAFAAMASIVGDYLDLGA